MAPRLERALGSDRAQTAQDFALGIGFFIVAVAFVFAFIPSMLAFTTADPGAKAAAQADRSSTSLIRDLGTNERPNELNGTLTADYFNRSASESALRKNLSLPNISFINVTVRTLDGDDVVNVSDRNGNEIRLAAGREYPQQQPAAEVARVVTVVNDDDACDPACQLVVRVW
jgi:hypothetical protein